jgi:kinesin family protein C1
LKEDAFEGEIARRGLHNLVQELKGNIRVYVRVRPVLANDHLGGAAPEDEEALEPEVASELAVACSPDGTSLELMPPAPRGSKEGFTKRELKPVSFSFDTVFGPRSTQEDVFHDVQHLVQSSLDGYNVCLFSYGQTGSGKTHTMQGGTGEHAGLIPRSVRQILDTSVKLAGQGWKYQLEVSFLEVCVYLASFTCLQECYKGLSAADLQ